MAPVAIIIPVVVSCVVAMVLVSAVLVTNHTPPTSHASPPPHTTAMASVPLHMASSRRTTRAAVPSLAPPQHMASSRRTTRGAVPPQLHIAASTVYAEAQPTSASPHGTPVFLGTPAELSHILIQQYHLKRLGLASQDQLDGNMVENFSVMDIIACLDNPLLCNVYHHTADVWQQALSVQPIAFEGTHVDLHFITHLQARHFTGIIVNHEHARIHVFDTWHHYTDQVVSALVQNTVWQGAAGYTIDNHTASMQDGPTCGPWTVWIFVAYVFNYHGLRGGADTLDLSVMSQTDALDFWRHVTYLDI